MDHKNIYSGILLFISGVIGMKDARKGADEAQDRPEDTIECCEMRISPNGTYEVYRAPSAALAKEFLSRKRPPGPDVHIIVETPEGNWCIDSEGIYLQKLLPYQLSIEKAQCRGYIDVPPTPFGLKMAALGFLDNFTAHVKCGQCGHVWLDGLRYRNKTLVRCPKCHMMNLVDSRRFVFRPNKIPKASVY